MRHRLRVVELVLAAESHISTVLLLAKASSEPDAISSLFLCFTLASIVASAHFCLRRSRKGSRRKACVDTILGSLPSLALASLGFTNIIAVEFVLWLGLWAAVVVVLLLLLWVV